MIKVKNLFTEYVNEKGEPVKAAQDVTFEVPEGKLFTLLGPSGCGKTTTLRSIAGLERPVSGEIEVGGAVVYSSGKNVFVQPNKRNFGMVFQSYAIWPHMNVFQNAAFPLEVAANKPSKAEIEQRVMRVLTAVGLDSFAERGATKLSGGQQQRLALARALVMQPKLLLLDEPLSNLDAKLRERMRFELKRMQRELGLTTIYVTHDQSEALALSHEIAVMNAGRIIQIGTPRDIYERPRNKFVADFVGLTNFIEATVEAQDAGGEARYIVETAVGKLSVTAFDRFAKGEQTVISVRPEDVELSNTRIEGGNITEGKVETKVFLGEYMDYQVRVADRLVLARVHPTFNVPTGSSVFLRMSPEKCICIADDPALKQAA